MPFVLVVNPDLPVQAVAELVEARQGEPGELTYGSGGLGAAAHLTPSCSAAMTGIKMTHVPYKGSVPAMTDLVAGHIQVMFVDIVPSIPLVRGGKARALGVTRRAGRGRAGNPAARQGGRAGLRHYRVAHDRRAGRDAASRSSSSCIPRSTR